MLFVSEIDPEFQGHLWEFKRFMKMKCNKSNMYNSVVFVVVDVKSPNVLHTSGIVADPSYFNVPCWLCSTLGQSTVMFHFIQVAQRKKKKIHWNPMRRGRSTIVANLNLALVLKKKKLK